MARLNDSLLNGRAYNRGTTHPVLNSSYGGMHGWSPDLREWVNNAAYVQRNVIALLLEAPAFFQMLTDSNIWVSTLRAMVELHPRTIDGLNMGLTVDTQGTPVGGAGEEQDEFIDVKRQRSNPVFTYNDKYGRPFQRFLEYWITYGLMDPASKVANVGTLANYPTDMLPDRYSMTVLFIEPDPTHRRVMKSWLCTNMFPKGTGDITGRRDLTSSMALPDLSIEFTALSQVGAGVDLLGQKMMDYLNVTNANPNMRSAFIQDIAQDVLAVQQGYKSKIDDIAQDALATDAQIG